MNPDAQTDPSPASPVPARKRPGGKYRLYKRDPAGREIPQYLWVAPASRGSGQWTLNPELPREGPYYFKFEFRGKRYPRCLETNDADEAQREARRKAEQIRESIIRDESLDNTRLRQPVAAKVAELVTVYDRSSVDAAADTRAQNIQSLYCVLCPEADGAADRTTSAGALSVTAINGDTGRRWFELQKKAIEQLDDQGEQLSAKISANSLYAKARSLFTPKALASYEEQFGTGIVAGCKAFHEAFNTFKFSRLPERHYNAPADNIVEKTLDAWEKLEDRDLFLVIGHELSFGLRKGEMSQATWPWWQVRSGYPVLDGTAWVKNNSNLIQVRALDPFFNTMRLKAEARRWRVAPASRGSGDDYIISGTADNRQDAIFRKVGDFLRQLGWETKKTNHALRDYAGSQIAMKFGIYEAQTWLRHSTVKVTEKHYTDFVKKFKPANPDEIPVRWAIAAQTFEPRVYTAAG